MGQRWSRIKPGQLESSNNLPEHERCISPSQATTETSSNISTNQLGLYSVCGADVEVVFMKALLSDSLKDEDLDERGKEAQTSPTPSTSQLSSSHIFSVGPEKVYLEKTQVALPMETGCNVGPLKQRACKQPQDTNSSPVCWSVPQLHIAKSDAEQVAMIGTTPSSSISSPSEVPDEEDSQNTEKDDDDDVTPSDLDIPPEQGHDVLMMGVKECKVFSQQPSSAQAILMFELNHKRKAMPAGLPSLAIECMGANHLNLKARTPIERPSVGGSKVLDLGSGEVMMGRCVKKAVGSCEFLEGHVSFYNAALRIYQVKYNDGQEEAMEWLDLEPSLIEQSGETTALMEEGEVKHTRKYLQSRPRFKKVDELVYTKIKG